MSLAPSKCALCGVESSLKCAGCKRVVYCSPEHQKKHWKRQHKNECAKPYEVKLRGRGLGKLRRCGKITGFWLNFCKTNLIFNYFYKFEVKIDLQTTNCENFHKNLLFPTKKENSSQVRVNFQLNERNAAINTSTQILETRRFADSVRERELPKWLNAANRSAFRCGTASCASQARELRERVRERLKNTLCWVGHHLVD